MLQRDRTRRLPARKRWRQSATVFAVLPLSGCGATVEVSNIKVLFDSAGPASGHGLASVARRHSDPHDRFLLAPNTVFPLPILRAAAATRNCTALISTYFIRLRPYSKVLDETICSLSTATAIQQL